MSEKSKNELLDELVSLKFITKKEKSDYDNLSNATLAGLIEKVSNKSNSNLEDDERLAYETTIENLKLELDEAKKGTSNAPAEDPVYLERRNRQALKKLVQDVESYAKQLVSLAKESIKDKA